MARTRGTALSLPLATLSRTTSSTAAYGSRATHTAALKLLAPAEGFLHIESSPFLYFPYRPFTRLYLAEPLLRPGCHFVATVARPLAGLPLSKIVGNTYRQCGGGRSGPPT